MTHHTDCWKGDTALDCLNSASPRWLQAHIIALTDLHKGILIVSTLHPVGIARLAHASELFCHVGGLVGARSAVRAVVT